MRNQERCVCAAHSTLIKTSSYPQSRGWCQVFLCFSRVLSACRMRHGEVRGIAHLLSHVAAQLLQTALPRLLCQLASHWAGRWEVLEGGWGMGETRVFLPLSLCLVGAGCPFSSTDYCLLVFGSYRATHSSVVQPRSGPGHDSATTRQDHHHPCGLPQPGVAVASP